MFDKLLERDFPRFWPKKVGLMNFAVELEGNLRPMLFGINQSDLNMLNFLGPTVSGEVMAVLDAFIVKPLKPGIKLSAFKLYGPSFTL